MARTTLALTSFVSGEFGNKLTGRTDFDKYQSAAKTLENFLVHPQGAATRRVGTQFIAPIKTAANKTRLVPFEFSTTQTYVLEFGNNYIRFFKDKGQILSGGNPYEISTPYLTAELFDIKFAQSADVMYLVHRNHEVMKLSRTGHTSWSLDEVDFTDGPYLATNSTETTLTPSGAETTTLNGTLGDNADGTSGSTIALTSASGFPTTGRIQVGTELISYSGVSTNNLTGITRAVDGSTRAAHSSGATVTNAGIGSRTITASAVTGINGGAGFLTTDVGRLISFNSGIAKITARTNTTVVVCTVSKGFTNTDATADWKLGAFSDTTGHPSCVSFFEQRLVFAGTTSEPQTIFFSKAGDYENMGSGTNADDAMVYTIAANQVNVILDI